MNSADAQTIADTWKSGSKLDSVKELRKHTGLGLIDAKSYLEKYDQGPEGIYVQVCSDYVQSPHDLLIRAREERRRLDLHIEDLEAQVNGTSVQNIFEQEQPDVG